MNQPDKKGFEIKNLFEKKEIFPEQVSDLIFKLNAIDASEEVEKIFNNLKVQKEDINDAYNVLSNSIKENIVELLDEVFNLKLKNLEIEKSINQISEKIKHIKPSLIIEESANNEEYKLFLNTYNESLEISQDILKKKIKTTHLVDTQALLDKSYASKMIAIDYQLLKLNDIISNFTEIKTPNLLEAYSKKFNNTIEYQSLIEESEMKFAEIKGKIFSDASDKLSSHKKYIDIDGINKDMFTVF